MPYLTKNGEIQHKKDIGYYALPLAIIGLFVYYRMCILQICLISPFIKLKHFLSPLGGNCWNNSSMKMNKNEDRCVSGNLNNIVDGICDK